MKRYFYLFCLLILIKCTLCYNHISGQKHEGRVKRGRLQRHKTSNLEGNRKKQGHNVDKELITLIDLASFIQKPDEYSSDNNFYDSINSKSQQNTYEEDSFGEDIIKRSNKQPHQYSAMDKSFDLGSNPFLYKDTINSRHLNLDSLSLHELNNGNIGQNRAKSKSKYGRALYDIGDSNIHKSEKKCALKQLVKLPFFSHDKSGSDKPKKSKKRKLLCFNCTNKKSKETTSITPLTGINEIKDESKKKTETISKDSLADLIEYSDLKFFQGKRDKRQEKWLSERVRQLNELDEIQRRVDAVNIISTFN